MTGIAQIGIALGALGVVLTLMGLFPGVTGIDPGRGVGIVQFAAIQSGFILLIVGALVYVKFSYYIGRTANLAQQIGVRLALTGLVLSGLSGLADFVGFGSHIRPLAPDVFLGPLQAVGILSGFLIAALGVVVYALAGPPPDG